MDSSVCRSVGLNSEGDVDEIAGVPSLVGYIFLCQQRLDLQINLFVIALDKTTIAVFGKIRPILSTQKRTELMIL